MNWRISIPAAEQAPKKLGGCVLLTPAKGRASPAPFRVGPAHNGDAMFKHTCFLLDVLWKIPLSSPEAM